MHKVAEIKPAAINTDAATLLRKTTLEASLSCFRSNIMASVCFNALRSVATAKLPGVVQPDAVRLWRAAKLVDNHKYRVRR